MKTEIKYGLITGVLGAAWLYIEYVIGLHDTYIDYHPKVTMFALFIPVVTIVLAIREKRNKSQEGMITFWQGVLTGFGVSLIAAIINVGAQWLYLTVINPEWTSFMVEMTRIKASEKLADPIQIENQVKEAEQYFTKGNYLQQSFYAPFILGIVISLIASGILRKKITN
ncbi:MAG: DUF4199 domain-containing protein [Bacteroidetes bacterium]|nr:DUF4199 domain-containing protein [Bacteroidota bacterium]HET6244590.1 DUF4199 domain-containing protein [Bacteroidia bacterium]